MERQDQSDPDEGREKKKTGVVKIYWSCRNKMDSWENPSKTWCLIKLCQHEQALKWLAFWLSLIFIKLFNINHSIKGGANV